MTDPNTEAEDLQAFRLRARAWLAEKMPLQSEGPGWIADDTERWQHHRSLQRTLFDGGFAGLCFPKEYGGQGLTPAHQRAFDDETAGYQMPVLLNVPTFGIIGATLLDFGSEEQKKRYLPAMLRGDADAGRRRIPAEWFEDLELRRIRGRLRDLRRAHRLGRPQAPGDLGLHRPGAPAGDHDRSDSRRGRRR